MAMMEIRNVYKTFRTYAKAGLRPGAHKVVSELPVLQGVDLTVEKGDVVAILGPSGSGKTTLLRCLNFLERPDTGCIRVNGETMWDAADPATQRESEVRKKRLHFGLVFQNFNLFPQYTALQNVMLAGELLAKERPDYKTNKKAIHAQLEQQAKALGDRANMIFNGTSVTQGTGRAIVTGTGMNTQVGKIADMLSATEDEKTPLQKEMDYVSKILGIAVCVIAVVVLVALAVLEGFNDVHDVIDSLLLAVSLAVAAVPEGLAAILTVVLALGVQRMAAHNAIVKKLHSVETLGSASVICSDKTGTLTRNEMTVERVVTPSGEVQITGTGYAPEGRMVMTGGVSPESEQAQIVADEVVATLVAGTLANDGELREENGRWEIVGDPTEVSLIVAARKVKADRKIKRYTRVGEIPFTSERKRMSIIAKDSTDSDKLTVFAKGAPDVLLSYCTRIRVGGQVRSSPKAIASRFSPPSNVSPPRPTVRLARPAVRWKPVLWLMCPV